MADDTVAVSMFAVVLKYLGNGDDGSVSGIVPVAVVDVFEIINIYNGKGIPGVRIVPGAVALVQQNCVDIMPGVAGGQTVQMGQAL